MFRIVLLTDRSPADVLPAATPMLLEAKTDHVSVDAIAGIASLDIEAVLVDAAENAGQGHAVLRALRQMQRPERRLPVVAVVERADLDRFRWEEVADDLLYPGAPESEIRVRLAMLARRLGASEGTTVRLGPLVLDVSSYRVSVGGMPLDLTFKEFELLRFLAERPGRVFTRPALMREVWGYDFYGGTRTVDVHIRRLRAKLGPAHENLIQTVRGVGYRASDA